jgi:hypothetical protein
MGKRIGRLFHRHKKRETLDFSVTRTVGALAVGGDRREQLAESRCFPQRRDDQRLRGARLPPTAVSRLS